MKYFLPDKVVVIFPDFVVVAVFVDIVGVIFGVVLGVWTVVAAVVILNVVSGDAVCVWAVVVDIAGGVVAVGGFVVLDVLIHFTWVPLVLLI